ncbi:MAG: DNA repair protein RadA, partial [Pseudomonadota bacterium]
MGKTASFSCTACGAVHSKWSGRCEACGEWNTIVEEAPLSTGPASKSLGSKRGTAIHLADLASEE